MTGRELHFSRQSTSLKQRVVECLREAILFGAFGPGQKLVEKELCKTLSVSRSLLREAMQHLEAEGLIVSVVHRGPTVAVIGPVDARNIYRIRECVEAIAAEGFAIHASDAQIAELRERLQKIKSLTHESSPKELVGSKNAFYETLVNGCGSDIIGQLLRILHNRATPLRRWSMAMPGRLPHMVVELEKVVCAIERRDGIEAGRLCAEHVQRASLAVLAHFGSQRVQGLAGDVPR